MSELYSPSEAKRVCADVSVYVRTRLGRDDRRETTLVRLPWKVFNSFQLLGADFGFEYKQERREWCAELVGVYRLHGIKVEGWSGNYVQMLKEL